jgi:hypothetical protein
MSKMAGRVRIGAAVFTLGMLPDVMAPPATALG